MSIITSIQWTHTTVNPVMGCDGCELYPTLALVRITIHQTIVLFVSTVSPSTEAAVRELTADGPQFTKLNIKRIAAELALLVMPKAQRRRKQLAEEIQKRVSALFVCYAATLHRAYNTNGKSSGYAFPFEKPKLTPGRVARTSLLPAPTSKEIEDKPWLNGFRRLIFISDMGDALSRDVPFQYLHDEIIESVASAAGKRHIWQWLTKRPQRMAEFGRWLNDRGIAWPDNLVAMTSVSGPESLSRVKQLVQVPARYRGLSVEPLWAHVTLPLKGISWVIVGGQSGKDSEPFALEWAESIRDDCRAANVPYFLKQLGRNPTHGGITAKLQDMHGGDWREWPDTLRIRELPSEWLQSAVSHAGSTKVLS